MKLYLKRIQLMKLRFNFRALDAKSNAMEEKIKTRRVTFLANEECSSEYERARNAAIGKNQRIALYLINDELLKMYDQLGDLMQEIEDLKTISRVGAISTPCIY